MDSPLATYLSVGGLTLDFIGAAFLAYDVLAGPQARLQASMRRDRLQAARRRQERHARSIQELSDLPRAPEEKMQRLRAEMSALTAVMTETLSEIRHWERHEARAHVNALVGLLLLMAGFACQGISAVLSATSESW